MKTLKLQLITQEKKLLEEDVLSVTLPAEDGEITVLPGHMNLFTRIKPGVVLVRTVAGENDRVVTVGGGFADVSSKEVKILAETAIRAEEIDEAKVEMAKKQSEEAMKNKEDRQRFIEAEASLRKALLELETAKRWRKMRGI